MPQSSRLRQTDARIQIETMKMSSFDTETWLPGRHPVAVCVMYTQIKQNFKQQYLSLHCFDKTCNFVGKNSIWTVKMYENEDNVGIPNPVALAA